MSVRLISAGEKLRGTAASGKPGAATQGSPGTRIRPRNLYIFEVLSPFSQVFDAHRGPALTSEENPRPRFFHEKADLLQAGLEETARIDFTSEGGVS